MHITRDKEMSSVSRGKGNLRVWTHEDEIRLFDLICDYKPAGHDKHKHMVSIIENINRGLEDRCQLFTAEQVWDKLEALYNLDRINSMEGFKDQAAKHIPSSPEEYDELDKTNEGSRNEVLQSRNDGVKTNEGQSRNDGSRTLKASPNDDTYSSELSDVEGDLPSERDLVIAKVESNQENTISKALDVSSPIKRPRTRNKIKVSDHDDGIIDVQKRTESDDHNTVTSPPGPSTSGDETTPRRITRGLRRSTVVEKQEIDDVLTGKVTEPSSPNDKKKEKDEIHEDADQNKAGKKAAEQEDSPSKLKHERGQKAADRKGISETDKKDESREEDEHDEESQGDEADSTSDERQEEADEAENHMEEEEEDEEKQNEKAHGNKVDKITRKGSRSQQELTINVDDESEDQDEKESPEKESQSDKKRKTTPSEDKERDKSKHETPIPPKKRTRSLAKLDLQDDTPVSTPGAASASTTSKRRRAASPSATNTPLTTNTPTTRRRTRSEAAHEHEQHRQDSHGDDDDIEHEEDNADEEGDSAVDEQHAPAPPPRVTRRSTRSSGAATAASAEKSTPSKQPPAPVRRSTRKK